MYPTLLSIKLTAFASATPASPVYEFVGGPADGDRAAIHPRILSVTTTTPWGESALYLLDHRSRRALWQAPPARLACAREAAYRSRDLAVCELLRRLWRFFV